MVIKHRYPHPSEMSAKRLDRQIESGLETQGVLAEEVPKDELPYRMLISIDINRILQLTCENVPPQDLPSKTINLNIAIGFLEAFLKPIHTNDFTTSLDKLNKDHEQKTKTLTLQSRQISTDAYFKCSVEEDWLFTKEKFELLIELLNNKGLLMSQDISIIDGALPQK